LAILKKEYLKGSMYYIWGNLKRETGDFEGALVCFRNAIKILQSKTSWNQLSYILLAKGVTYKKMGEYQKSQLFFDLAQVTVDEKSFRRLHQLIREEIEDLNDSNVDIYLDRHNRVIHERTIGTIDFKHRFVLLEILFLLAKNPGSYYDKDKLASDIWKDEYNPLIHDKLIYTSVSRLRKLIEPKNNARKYILRGKDGYTFNPRVNIRFHRERENSAGSGIANVEINIPV
jgi:tetratricopeptide (TPR) repeat protein